MALAGTAERVKNTLLGPIGEFVGELFKTVPDAVQFGALALYLLTQNYTMGIFTLFTFETTLFHKAVSFVFKGAGGSDVGAVAGEGNKDPRCRAGFRSPRFEFERRFMADTYPSLGVFFFGAMCVYLSFATYLFSDTLTLMGPAWSGRIPFSTVFVVTILLSVVLYRIFSGCDTVISTVVALFIGALTGAMFYFVNYNVFGIESMNFLGLPYVVDKSEQGSPIYVCAPTLT
jgi:hypothetical protein